MEITAQEMIRGLYYECGLGAVYRSFSSSDTYWKVPEEDKNGEIHALHEYRDYSYHGSPYYKPTGSMIKDPRKIRAYHLLNEFKGILEELENEQ